MARTHGPRSIRQASAAADEPLAVRTSWALPDPRRALIRDAKAPAQAGDSRPAVPAAGSTRIPLAR